MRGARGRLAAGALALALASGGLSFVLFGGGEAAGDGGDPRFLPGNSRAGSGGALSQVPEADCGQWERANPQQRRYVVAELGATFGRGGNARLPDDFAYSAIAQACAEDFASAFKLWKIYEHALAFQYDRSVLDR